MQFVNELEKRLESDLENVGKNIRAIRLIKRMTQSQLAQEIGANQQSLARWEKGEGLKLEWFLRISYALGVPPEHFFDLESQTINRSYIPRRREEDWEFGEKAAVPKRDSVRGANNHRAQKAA